jgi:FtsH-binding integral membrane protein
VYQHHPELREVIPMYATTEPRRLSNGRVWTGRIITGFVAVFLAFDAVTKIMQEPHTVQAAAQLGLPAAMISGIGMCLAVCLVIYLIPRTAPIGAILLTSYLGGAVVTNVHAGLPVLMWLFPAAFGVLVWAGLVLRDPRLEVLIAPTR